MPRAAGLVLVALLLAACSDVPPAPTRPPPTAFERQLAGVGADVTLPRPGRAIVVNVPSFELIAVDDGRPVLRSRVIVGTPRNPTPILSTYTRAVTFRPTWRPTPAMVASGEYQDRLWPAGPDNPLGLAAIRLAPGLLVYLHDTNTRRLFERDYRALSHGCIRVQKWDELIAWLLGRDRAEVLALANGSRTFDMAAPRVPVHILYSTRFPAEDGTIFIHPDIYGRDTVTRGGALAGSGCPAATDTGG